MSDASTPSSRKPLLFTAAAVVLGAMLGGLYAHFIGCRTGTCPITSSVRNASLYGGFVGLVIAWPGRRRHGRSARQAEGPHPPPQGAPAPPQR